MREPNSASDSGICRPRPSAVNKLFISDEIVVLFAIRINTSSFGLKNFDSVLIRFLHCFAYLQGERIPKISYCIKFIICYLQSERRPFPPACPDEV